MPRFMGFVRMEENIGEPPQSLFGAMDAYIGERAANGVFIDGGGLYGTEDASTSSSARASVAGGLAALTRASELAACGAPVGTYFLQASIAALYDVLAQAAPGPVVEVNRAVAHGRAYGSAAGLAVLAAVDPASLGDSPLVPSVRGDLLERAGDAAGAASAFREAAGLTRNDGERVVLLRRADQNTSTS